MTCVIPDPAPHFRHIKINGETWLITPYGAFKLKKYTPNDHEKQGKDII